MNLYTTGYCGDRTERGVGKVNALVNLVTSNNLALIDIRLSARSMAEVWSGYSLRRTFGERYIHIPDLGNINYNNHGPILIASLTRGAGKVIELMQGGRYFAPLLLCACEEYDCCHRRHVVEHLATYDLFACAWEIHRWDMPLPVLPPDLSPMERSVPCEHH